MSRKKHAKKEIEAALVYAESKGWKIEEAGKSAHVGDVYTVPIMTTSVVAESFVSRVSGALREMKVAMLGKS